MTQGCGGRAVAGFGHSPLSEFEQYSTADATFAVDSLDIDWLEQAVGSAEAYLDFSAFSCGGLIDQLEFEGFTPEQAQFGAAAAGIC